MYKVTLAVAALLGVLDTQAIQVQQRSDLDMMEVETDENLTADTEALDPEDDIADYEQLSQDDQELVETQLDEQLSSSCSAGIRRWDTSANSLSAWQKAEKGSNVFQDSEFEGWSALYSSSTLSSYTSSTARGWKRKITGWARPSQTYQQKRTHKGVTPSLWGKSGKPRPEGITQRSLGDCWFLASASAVAEQPNRITRIVQNSKYSKNGAFRFYFWVEKKWVGINIDDRLPVAYGKYNYILFTNPSLASGAWWMPLMEKAYAKLDQDYQRLIGGWGFEGLRTLTGMPTTSIPLPGSSPTAGQIDAMWKLVKPLAEKNYPMTTGCCHSRKPYGGIYSGHAYTLLNLVELSNGQKLAVIRNPHNKEKYKGDWHDGDTRWTSKYKKEAGYVSNSMADGLFFMPWEKYAANFRRISVSLYQQYGGYAQKTKSQTGRTMCYYINNPTEQEMYVNVEGVNARNVPRTCKLDSMWVSELRYPQGNRVQDTPDANWKYSHAGWTFNGKMGKVPAGKYKLMVQRYSGSTAKFTINVYWKDKQGTIS